MVKKSKDMANLFLAAKIVGGTGGGEQPVLVTKNITENGIYAASADNADGYSQVTVDVAPPAPLSPTRSGATIYDYDGSVIATYTPEEFAALTEYPTHPTHEFLTGDGYNWSLANAQAYSAKYGYVEVGAQYRVTDGKTRLFITLSDGRLEPQLGLGINGSVDVDWGDGSAHDTMTGSSLSTPVFQSHKYATEGDYVIELAVIGEIAFLYDSTKGAWLLTGNQLTANGNAVYRNAISRINVGSSVTSIGNGAFDSCYSLASVTIPSSVTSIGNGAFSGCYSLASVTIPSSVTSIASSAFGSCYSLASVTISNGVTSINTYAFYNCYSLASVTIPNGVAMIGTCAFQNCYSLTSVTIPNSVVRIDTYAFQSCYSLASVTIPDRVTSISDNAFQNCYSLTSVTISNGVARINTYVFYNCYSLASVTIPSSVASIRNGAFSGCYGLSFIKFESETPPTVANVNAFNNLPTDCTIYVPHGTLATYTSATNYPDPATYTYVEY